MLSPVAVLSSPKLVYRTSLDQPKYVQIIVFKFLGEISSSSYLLKCSHVPTPKSKGISGFLEGSPRRLDQVAGILAALPHICHWCSTRKPI